MSNIINIDDVKLDDSERQRCEVYTRVMGYIRPKQNSMLVKKANTIVDCASVKKRLFKAAKLVNVFAEQIQWLWLQSNLLLKGGCL